MEHFMAVAQPFAMGALVALVGLVLARPARG